LICRWCPFASGAAPSWQVVVTLFQWLSLGLFFGLQLAIDLMSRRKVIAKTRSAKAGKNNNKGEKGC
jgi:hypothetical protein